MPRFNEIDLRSVRKQELYALSDKFQGTSPCGEHLGFTNYYMTLNGKPFFVISGECHFSRVNENQWEDTILQMKAGGLNTIATYVFWNHHEEEEGVFCFEGRKNLRRFIQLCGKHGMYVIVRIGPFDHGEVRNGGFPDWLFGKPVRVRTTDPGFLFYVRRLYHEISHQLDGLLYQDGGPVIAAQMDNEYMHSAAPWEMMAGSTDEWITKGEEGDRYLLALKKIAQEEGIRTPFYTCTGWGGAATPAEEMLPLWGGYAFWPWIFPQHKGPHPVTPEYLYRDMHNNAVPATYNFEPKYEPESVPYACCEMGGGMNVTYAYRFQVPFESVDAMSNIKIAGGCNFLGYYMYRGGSNPSGKRTEFMNEGQCPKITYDYQAPIGEFGQIRMSYHRLRRIHLFATAFESQLCQMVTMLPKGAESIDPKDQEPLRFAVRTNGQSGFLFLNNFQDHTDLKDKKDETIVLHLKDGDLSIGGIGLAAGEEAILPFHLELDGGVHLLYATAQPISLIREENRTTYFFFSVKGMDPVYSFDPSTIASGEARQKAMSDTMTVAILKGKKDPDREIRIVTLTQEQSLDFYQFQKRGKSVAILSNVPVAFDEDSLLLTADAPVSYIRTAVMAGNIKDTDAFASCTPYEDGVFSGFCAPVSGMDEVPVPVQRIDDYRYLVSLPEIPSDWKDAILRIRYHGDVGQVFRDGRMVSDNYYNGLPWDIGLFEAMPGAGTRPLVRIVPIQKDKSVDTSSVMAGRSSTCSSEEAELESVHLQPVKAWKVELGQ